MRAAESRPLLGPVLLLRSDFLCLQTLFRTSALFFFFHWLLFVLRLEREGRLQKHPNLLSNPWFIDKNSDENQVFLLGSGGALSVFLRQTSEMSRHLACGRRRFLSFLYFVFLSLFFFPAKRWQLHRKDGAAAVFGGTQVAVDLAPGSWTAAPAWVSDTGPQAWTRIHWTVPLPWQRRRSEWEAMCFVSRAISLQKQGLNVLEMHRLTLSEEMEEKIRH